MSVTFTSDAAHALSLVGASLRAEPVRHNLLLSLLTERASHPEPGRYWVIDRTAVVFQSPLTFAAIVSPMEVDTVEAVVDAICDAEVELPGVIGEAATAARFAGYWSERHKTAAIPWQGQRLYELSEPKALQAEGYLRIVTREDRELLIQWAHRFNEDLGQGATNVEAILDQRAFCIWEDGAPVSMAAHTQPVEGVVRVQYVYTPPEHRRHGYAGACVAYLSQQLHDQGLRCALYTDLGNPTSNSIYRRIGYRAVQEVMRYKFG